MTEPDRDTLPVLPVTQTARNAAAAIHTRFLRDEAMAVWCVTGKADKSAIVQAFAAAELRARKKAFEQAIEAAAKAWPAGEWAVTAAIRSLATNPAGKGEG